MTASPYQTLSVGTDSRGVTRVVLNRLDVLNAFDETMIGELTAAFERIAADSATRVVILAAAGRAFCAGADLRWMERASTNSEQANLDDARRFAHMMNVLHSCPKPVIARVHGAALGGGVGLCCACDIVVSVPQAKFAVSEAKFGILPAVIGPYLTNAVGKRHALRLALTAEVIGGLRAAEIGLVHELAQPEKLDEAIETIISNLLRNGPLALGEIKCWFDQLHVGPVTAQVREQSALTIARVRCTDEAREGFGAFLGKRAAAWVQP
ncbi:MAG: Enoyl-CoA hydratase [Gammaproteobacteria bacterium]|nr:Enoyl-CoA hydratase [Gammaproteobacteria bacterium]